MAMTEEEFLKAYDRHADAIFRHCFFRLRQDRELAKELTQETFLRVWQIGSKKEVKYVRALLYKVATNLVIDHSRKKRESSVEEMEEKGVLEGTDPTEELHRDLTTEALLQYLDRIDPKHKEVLMFRYIDQLKPKEIARITGESANVISVRLTRAKRELKYHVKPYEKDI